MTPIRVRIADKHPIESEKLQRAVKRAMSLLDRGVGKVTLTFDVKDSRAVSYNVGVEFPRESAS